MDRRIARTRRFLRAAILELIEQKPIEEITIQDITDKADTARVTFYRHYADKNELLLDCLDEIYQELIEAISPPAQFAHNEAGPLVYQTQKLWYEYVDSRRQTFRTLLGSSLSASIRRHLRGLYMRQISLFFHGLDIMPAVTIPADILTVHIAESQIGLLDWWLETDSAYSPELLANISTRLMETGLFGIIGKAVEPGDISATPFHMPAASG